MDKKEIERMAEEYNQGQVWMSVTRTIDFIAGANAMKPEMERIKKLLEDHVYDTAYSSEITLIVFFNSESSKDNPDLQQRIKDQATAGARKALHEFKKENNL